MAQDVKLAKNDDGIFDIPLTADGKDIATVDGIETALMVSLYTNARTSGSKVPDSFNRQGWAGNLLTLKDGFELGSELWTLKQARLVQNTLNAGQDLVRRSLQWMIDDGVADVINVTMTSKTDRAGEIKILLYKDLDLIARYITIWTSTQPIG
jgi:phage gp46-like protein